MLLMRVIKSSQYEITNPSPLVTYVHLAIFLNSKALGINDQKPAKMFRMFRLNSKVYKCSE